MRFRREASPGEDELLRQRRRTEELRIALAELGDAMIESAAHADDARLEVRQAVGVCRERGRDLRPAVEAVTRALRAKLPPPPSDAQPAPDEAPDDDGGAVLLARALAARGASRQEAAVLMQQLAAPADAAPALDATYGLAG